ncbi:CsgG/HfaB family protein [uncultured Treponema sp.]|uniref:CsgG/HfaB family protein n=1 Tax=uncultured Treponema sp. TaxID=162155 RepID=UPI00259299AE|nr:CsgG/HfaB family protein [uncultured Treponema sp.]
MKKNILLSVLTLCFFISAFGQSKPTVVIVPFDARGVPADEVEILTDSFINEYAGTNVAKIVDRGSFDKIAREQKFQASEWSATEKIASLGKALNANQMITGQVSKFGEMVIFNLKCIDVNTTEIIYSIPAKKMNSTMQIFDSIPQIAKDISTQAKYSMNIPYPIGSKGPAGGYIFAVDGDKRWEVSESIDYRKYDYYQCKESIRNYIQNKYRDWQVPTKSQLIDIFNTLCKKGLVLQKDVFFSDDPKYLVSLETGKEVYMSKYVDYQVRLMGVRCFYENSLSVFKEESIKHKDFTLNLKPKYNIYNDINIWNNQQINVTLRLISSDFVLEFDYPVKYYWIERNTKKSLTKDVTKLSETTKHFYFTGKWKYVCIDDGYKYGITIDFFKGEDGILGSFFIKNGQMRFSLQLDPLKYSLYLEPKGITKDSSQTFYGEQQINW